MPRQEPLQLVENRRFRRSNRQLHLLHREPAEQIALPPGALEVRLDAANRRLHRGIDLQQRPEMIDACERREELLRQRFGNAHFPLEVVS